MALQTIQRTFCILLQGFAHTARTLQYSKIWCFVTFYCADCCNKTKVMESMATVSSCFSLFFCCTRVKAITAAIQLWTVTALSRILKTPRQLITGTIWRVWKLVAGLLHCVSKRAHSVCLQPLLLTQYYMSTDFHNFWHIYTTENMYKQGMAANWPTQSILCNCTTFYNQFLLQFRLQ